MFSAQKGVGDVWTDPQFHTSYATSDFGKGNLEQMGIDGFFKSHKCNSICEYLGIGKVRFLLIGLKPVFGLVHVRSQLLHLLIPYTGRKSRLGHSGAYTASS